MADSTPNPSAPSNRGPSFFNRTGGRFLITCVAGLLMFVGAVGVFAALVANRPQVEQKPVEVVPLNVDVFAVQECTGTEILHSFGTAVADKEVTIAAQVAGDVTSLHPNLRVGQQIRSRAGNGSAAQPEEQSGAAPKPDLLLTLNPEDYEQRLAQADSRIAEARTEIGRLQQTGTNVQRQLERAREDVLTAKDDYQRIRQALERGAGSAAQVNQALLTFRQYEDKIVQLESEQALIPHQIEAAEQRLQTAEVDRETALTSIERTRIYAPFDGVISDVSVEQGQYMRPGEALLRIVDPNRIEIPVSLPFSAYVLITGKLNSGSLPEVALSEHENADPRWEGTLVRLSPDVDASSRTIDAFVEVLNSEHPELPLLPGTFVHARITGPRFRGALIIPRDAVVGDDTVFVVQEDDTILRRRVSIVRPLRSFVMVQGEIQAGDRIAVTNLDVLSDGLKIGVQGKMTIRDELAAGRAAAINIDSVSPDVEGDEATDEASASE